MQNLNLDRSQEQYIVFDNLQILFDAESKRKILELAAQENVWLVLIGRCPVPLWLRPLHVSGSLIVIDEKDLHLSANEIVQIAQNQELALRKEDAEFLERTGDGNAFAIMTALANLKEGHSIDELLQKRGEEEFQAYLESEVISQWDADIQEFLMKVSVVDSFTLEMAKAITGDERVLALIERSLYAGNFLKQDGNEWKLRNELLGALRNAGRKRLGEHRMKLCAYNAGRCYEAQENIIEALKMYELSGEQDAITSLLIANGRRNPGAGHFYELRKYYLALEPEIAEKNVILMSALSMLYSILLRPEESEQWYEKLKKYAGTQTGGNKREAEIWLIYLDIALPHRGSADVLELLKLVPKILWNRGNQLPEMSLTNNQPSTMNGGKDFCEWSKRDVFLADSIGKLAEKAVRGVGQGLIHAALGESFYEKGMDYYTVLNHLTRAQLESENSGKQELTFAAVGLQARQSLTMGNSEMAITLIETFLKQIINAESPLYANAEALRIRLALYTGEQALINQWLEEKAPNEESDFCTLERYRYLTKLRIYLSRGMLMKAMSLLCRLQYYAEINKRTYVQMELEILRAIIRYRNGEEWKPDFEKVLKRAAEYQFVRIFSEEGAAILPLLTEVRKDAVKDLQIGEDYFRQIYKEASMMAKWYPAYGGAQIASLAEFREEELQVLRMQADGMTLKDIAEAMQISERTAKYYAAQNYKRLGVKGKTDAVQKARSLNIL